VGGCLNSRPLYPTSNNPSDLTAIILGHFLVGESLVGLPEPGEDERELPRNCKQHLELVYSLRNSFWRRWSREYLHHLQLGKWKKSPNEVMEVSTLVLIKDDHVATIKWTMGRIVQIYSDADGLVRVVTVKTTDSLRRSLRKICPLPIRAPEPQDDRVCKRVHHSGRRFKKFVRH